MSRRIVLQWRFRRNRQRRGLGEDEFGEIGWVDQRLVREEWFRLRLQVAVVLYSVNVEIGFPGLKIENVLTRHSPPCPYIESRALGFGEI